MNSRPDDIAVDPDAPASEEELAAAEKLRLALEDPSRASGEAELARALSLSHAPREISASLNAALVAKALAPQTPRRADGRRVIRVAFGAAAATLAIAAAAALLLRPGANEAPQVAVVTPIPLVQVRSTAPLFHAPFEATNASARIDRIALARSDDLRENRYATWGVK